MTSPWTPLLRPGYFGRRRDEKIAGYNEKFGEGNWRLVWWYMGDFFDFESACISLYGESYFRYLKNRTEDTDFICLFNEVIDNAPTNIASGRDYTKQEAFSTHIQDIAIRNALHRLGLKFTKRAGEVLRVSSADSNGYRWGPGNVPFMDPDEITQPSLCPKWGNAGSVEDFWQSNKMLQIKPKGT